MFYNGHIWVRRAYGAMFAINTRLMQFERYLGRWMAAIDPGETGWME